MWDAEGYALPPDNHALAINRRIPTEIAFQVASARFPSTNQLGQVGDGPQGISKMVPLPLMVNWMANRIPSPNTSTPMPSKTLRASLLYNLTASELKLIQNQLGGAP